ncbi:DUF4340 domain-containing protein [Thermogutta sp.]|uniref:DUF4340 domain-containing protein n=1 Tax=Thermogutta sp. TaxID=1962930 RepID=UPI003C7EA55E
MNNELKKTLVFIGATSVILIIAWWNHYTPTTNIKTELRGQLLCPNLTDALAATSLEIFEYDPNAVRIKNFKVAQINNRWCIPSHENYPADAKEHLAQAATALIGVKILDVASESPTQDELVMYGVVEPTNDAIKTVTRGVGKRVVFRDGSDKVLADVIIGNKVPDREELRYVRVKGAEPVYIVKLSDDKFSSEFGDWIEKDLLQLNPWDIRDVQLHDYSFDPVTAGITPRSQVVLSYDDLGNPRWKLVRSLIFDLDKGTWTPRELAQDEELDTAKLDGLRTALDDLKIVDVRRKPQGISASLSADGSVKANKETAASLGEAGFFLASAQQFYQIFPMIGQRQIKPGDVEVISSEGEVRVGMKDGVRYLLRFGRVVEGQSGNTGSSGVNRYLFVVAEFDPELIPKPELEPLPELPANNTGAPSQPSGQQSASSSEQKSTVAAEETSQQTTVTKSTGEQNAPAGNAQSSPANAQQTAQEAKGQVAGSASGQAKSDTSPQSGQQSDQAQKKPEDIKAERERIEKENKRKQDEYHEKIKKGQERVKELNSRFADWYYIISDEVYRKIHLGLSDIIKKKEQQTEQKSDQTSQTQPGASETGEKQPSAQTPATPSETKSESAENQKPAGQQPAQPQASETSAKANDSGAPSQPEQQQAPSDTSQQSGLPPAASPPAEQK